MAWHDDCSRVRPRLRRLGDRGHGHEGCTSSAGNLANRCHAKSVAADRRLVRASDWHYSANYGLGGRSLLPPPFSISFSILRGLLPDCQRSIHLRRLVRRHWRCGRPAPPRLANLDLVALRPGDPINRARSLASSGPMLCEGSRLAKRSKATYRRLHRPAAPYRGNRNLVQPSELAANARSRAKTLTPNPSAEKSRSGGFCPDSRRMPAIRFTALVTDRAFAKLFKIRSLVMRRQDGCEPNKRTRHKTCL